MTEPQPHHSAEKPLQSWKEIAAYLERDVRTVGRWAKENGLPVRRHGTGKGSSVYAFPSEIAAWSAVVGGGNAPFLQLAAEAGCWARDPGFGSAQARSGETGRCPCT